MLCCRGDQIEGSLSARESDAIKYKAGTMHRLHQGIRERMKRPVSKKRLAIPNAA
jgi:hypothetical protein